MHEHLTSFTSTGIGIINPFLWLGFPPYEGKCFASGQPLPRLGTSSPRRARSREKPRAQPCGGQSRPDDHMRYGYGHAGRPLARCRHARAWCWAARGSMTTAWRRGPTMGGRAERGQADRAGSGARPRVWRGRGRAAGVLDAARPALRGRERTHRRPPLGSAKSALGGRARGATHGVGRGGVVPSREE
ncbi:hypothetical protein D1007_44362 [Hordeum vulgare]|nr:hypothetical protein D1007_44362 [Hordeum vulgare]